MPFMHGRGAVSRTLQFLQNGQITLSNSVRIMIFGYNAKSEDCALHPHHTGLYNYVFWHLPQLKYKNPEVQMVTVKMMTPNPWIKVYFEDDTTVLIDCYRRTREEIHDHIKKVLGRTDDEIRREVREASMRESDPANFGPDCVRQCICEVAGQVPCPGWEKLPPAMTGKGQKKLLEQQQEEAERNQ